MSSTAVKEALSAYKENELILAGKLYREQLTSTISEAAYYKMLERRCKSGELMKAAKGAYYIPKKSRFGVAPISEKEIISAFTKAGSGTVIGYSMYNTLKLTTQVSKKVEILSSAIEEASRTVRNIVVRQARVDYTDEMVGMIQALEVLQNFRTIQDLDHKAFLSYTQEVAARYQDRTFEAVIQKIRYKKSTIAFLQEILRYYGMKNRLYQHLSAMSEYKIPRMEELYEAARA